MTGQQQNVSAEKIEQIAQQVNEIHIVLAGYNGKGGLVQDHMDVKKDVQRQSEVLAGMTGVRGFARDAARILLMAAALMISLWASGAFSR